MFKVKPIGNLICVPLSILSTLNLPHSLGYSHWILLPLAVASAVIYVLSTVPLAQVSESQYKLSLVQNGYDSKHSPFLNRHWDYWVSSWFNFCNLWHCFYEQTHRSTRNNIRNLGIIRKYSSARCKVRLTFNLRFSLTFSLTFSLKFKQTIDLQPDVTLSSYSSAVHFQYRNTIFSGALHTNFIKFTYVV